MKVNIYDIALCSCFGRMSWQQNLNLVHDLMWKRSFFIRMDIRFNLNLGFIKSITCKLVSSWLRDLFCLLPHQPRVTEFPPYWMNSTRPTSKRRWMKSKWSCSILTELLIWMTLEEVQPTWRLGTPIAALSCLAVDSHPPR